MVGLSSLFTYDFYFRPVSNLFNKCNTNKKGNKQGNII
jgi:hypothetical protein